MNYVALSNRIVAKKRKVEEMKSASGIILTAAESLKTPYITAEIVYVGRGYVAQNGQIVPMESKVGDVVLLTGITPFILPKEDGDGLQDGEEYIVFQESDIFVRLKRDGE